MPRTKKPVQPSTTYLCLVCPREPETTFEKAPDFVKHLTDAHGIKDAGKARLIPQVHLDFSDSFANVYQVIVGQGKEAQVLGSKTVMLPRI